MINIFQFSLNAIKQIFLNFPRNYVMVPWKSPWNFIVVAVRYHSVILGNWYAT